MRVAILIAALVSIRSGHADTSRQRRDATRNSIVRPQSSSSANLDSTATTTTTIQIHRILSEKTTTVGNKGRCNPSGQCEICPGGKRSGREGCEETGKRQKLLCPSENDNDDADDDDPQTATYQSCKRTVADEEYLMVRLQCMCVVFAFFALRTVRREKMASESLFDQRKRISRQQEMVPLTTANSNDIDPPGTTIGNGSGHFMQSVGLSGDEEEGSLGYLGDEHETNMNKKNEDVTVDRLQN